MKLPLALALLAAGPALAAPYTFTPLPAGFTAVGLNNLGQVSGQEAVTSPSGQPNLSVPALYSNGAVTPLNVGTFPSMDTVGGINSAGDFVIFENFGGHGEAFAAWFKARSHGEAGLVLVGRMMASSRFQRWCKYGSRYWRSSEATRE